MIASLIQTLRARPREAGVASVGVVGVCAVVMGSLGGRPAEPAWPSAVVRTAAFVDTIVESGTLNASRLMLYSAPAGAGQSKILELIPEGTDVRSGDVLVRFDDATLQQTLLQQEAAVALRRDRHGE